MATMGHDLRVGASLTCMIGRVRDATMQPLAGLRGIIKARNDTNDDSHPLAVNFARSLLSDW